MVAERSSAFLWAWVGGDCRNQALTQVCAFPLPSRRMMSVIAIRRGEVRVRESVRLSYPSSMVKWTSFISLISVITIA